MSNETRAIDLQQWGTGSSVSSKLYNPIIVSGVPPPFGMVKVSFDASWKEVEVGAGFIIRDYKSDVLRAGVRRIKASSVPEAELHAVWEGIFVATNQLHFEKIYLEGDSAIVISWITKNSKLYPTSMMHLHPLLSDIVQSLSFNAIFFCLTC